MDSPRYTEGPPRSDLAVRRDWLSISWNALLVAYAAAAVPLLGAAIVQAL
jgi:hypothetical protein